MWYLDGGPLVLPISKNMPHVFPTCIPPNANLNTTKCPPVVSVFPFKKQTDFVVSLCLTPTMDNHALWLLQTHSSSPEFYSLHMKTVFFFISIAATLVVPRTRQTDTNLTVYYNLYNYEHEIH